MAFVNEVVIIDITIRRGDTKPFRFTASDINGDADITGFSFLMTINSERKPTDIAAQLFQMTGNIIQADPGIIDFEPGSTDTDLTPGTYFYDIQVIDGSSKKHTPVQGKFKVTQDITKS